MSDLWPHVPLPPCRGRRQLPFSAMVPKLWAKAPEGAIVSSQGRSGIFFFFFFEKNAVRFNTFWILHRLPARAVHSFNVRSHHIPLDDTLPLPSRVSGGCYDKKEEEMRVLTCDGAVTPGHQRSTESDRRASHQQVPVKNETKIQSFRLYVFLKRITMLSGHAHLLRCVELPDK